MTLNVLMVAKNAKLIQDTWAETERSGFYIVICDLLVDCEIIL